LDVWLKPGQGLVWNELPRGAWVFDPSTGETHFLSGLPALIVELVASQPIKEDDLLREITASDDPAAELLSQLQAALHQLEEAGLIERRTSIS
jgi:PqqD family protein of HPr-rel-A system